MSQDEEVFMEADEPDEELIQIFLEEANEILESLQALLEKWSENLTHDDVYKDFLRELHTLKGCARLVGQEILGQCVHTLESVFRLLQEKQLEPNKALYRQIVCAIDHFFSMLDSIKMNRPVTQEDIFAQFETGQLHVNLESNVAQTPATPNAYVQPLSAIQALVQDIQGSPDAQQIAHIVDSLQIIQRSAKDQGFTGCYEFCAKFESLMKRANGQLTSFSHWQNLVQQGVSILHRLCTQQATTSPREQGAPVDWIEQVNQLLSRPQVKEKVAMVTSRVGKETLEQLNRLAGLNNMTRARLHQNIVSIKRKIEGNDIYVRKLDEQLKQLEAESESGELENFQAKSFDIKAQLGWDALEFNHYGSSNYFIKVLRESTSELLEISDQLKGKIDASLSDVITQGMLSNEIEECLHQTLLVPFESIVPRLKRMVRQISQELSKEVGLNVINVEGEMDKSILEKLIPSLEHIIRNAIDHGIESPEERQKNQKSSKGRIQISFTRHGATSNIEIQDDGAGIDEAVIEEKAIKQNIIAPDHELTKKEIINLILKPGFSTRDEVTMVSGRGVGLDVVNMQMQDLGGNLLIDTTPFKGTKFTIRLPFTLSLNKVMFVKVSQQFYCIPMSQITGVGRFQCHDLKYWLSKKQPKILQNGESFQLYSLSSLLELPSTGKTSGNQPVIFCAHLSPPCAFAIDNVMASREVVIKSGSEQLSRIPEICGAVILSEGEVVLVLDIQQLIQGKPFAKVSSSPQKSFNYNPRVLVVDDSITVRKVMKKSLEHNYFEVLTAKDGIEAFEILNERSVDVLLTDIEMPRMDGYELIKKVRAHPRLGQIPIITISSRSGDKHQALAYTLGANACLAKPYDEKKLLSTMQNLMQPKG